MKIPIESSKERSEYIIYVYGALDVRLFPNKHLNVDLKNIEIWVSRGLNVIITTPNPVLYRSIDTGINSQNADYIAGLMSEAIDNIGPNRFLRVCTDNAAACKKAWAIIEKKYEDHFIVCFGCAAHILHLLVKDVLDQPSANAILKSATAISKEIKYSHILASTFAMIQKSAPLEKRVTKNLNLLAISECKEKLNVLAKQLLLSSEFWIQIRQLIKLLKLFIVWLIRTESNETQISAIYELFIELEAHLINQSETPSSILSYQEFQTIFKCLQHRKNMTLRPIHAAVNILDPSRKRNKLNQEDFPSGNQFIINLHEKFHVNKQGLMIELMHFNGSKGAFSMEHVIETSELVHPVDWWQGNFKDSALAKIAISILSLPCTSAATERSFNTYSWIHTSKRNRLKMKEYQNLFL